MRALRGPLILLGVTVVVVCVVVAVGVRARSEEQPEVAWLREYVAWVSDVQVALDSGVAPTCDEPPGPPNDRVEPSVRRADVKLSDLATQLTNLASYKSRECRNRGRPESPTAERRLALALLAADLAHRARRAHEARVIDAVLQLLVRDGVADQRGELVVVRAGAERCLQVPLAA